MKISGAMTKSFHTVTMTSIASCAATVVRTVRSTTMAITGSAYNNG